MRRQICLLLLATTHFGAAAACLNPFGCPPKNLEECRQQAAKMPTDRGVTVAIADCNEKFIHKPKRDYEAGTRALWEVMMEGEAPALAKILKVMGKPATTSKPGVCTVFPAIDKKLHPKQCVTYTWGEDVLGARMYVAEIDQSTERLWSHATGLRSLRDDDRGF